MRVRSSWQKETNLQLQLSHFGLLSCSTSGSRSRSPTSAMEVHPEAPSGELLSGGMVSLLTRIMQCFLWCPLSCRGLCGGEARPFRAGADSHANPPPTPAALRSRAFLNESEAEDGGSSIDLERVEDEASRRRQPWIDVSLPAEKTAPSSSEIEEAVARLTDSQELARDVSEDPLPPSALTKAPKPRRQVRAASDETPAA